MTKTPEEIAQDIAEDATLVGYADLREWLCDAITAAIQAERDEAEKYKEAAELNARIIRDARRQARVEVQEALEEAAAMFDGVSHDVEPHLVAAEIRALAKEPDHAG